jgi:hypothetical protein
MTHDEQLEATNPAPPPSQQAVDAASTAAPRRVHGVTTTSYDSQRVNVITKVISPVWGAIDRLIGQPIHKPSDGAHQLDSASDSCAPAWLHYASWLQYASDGNQP